MRAIRTAIGATEILIEAIDENIEIIDQSKMGRKTQVTGISRETELTGIDDEVRDAYLKVKSVIKDIATEIGENFKAIAEAVRPKKAEMELNLGFSAQAKAWVISGKADCAIKVKMIWELEKNE